MKKNIFIMIIALSFLISACTDGFDGLNTNKNAPAKANADLLLPTVIFDLANITVNQSYVFNDIVAQYAGNYEYNDLDLYRWYADDRFWTPMYHILEDIKDLRTSGQQLGNENYKAVALVLEAYIYSVITDCYGPAPMSEANRTSEGYTTPKYDSQEEIYTAIFKKLDEANTLFNAKKSIDGDILYKGNVLKWRKFANSLHIRLLMRVSKVKKDVASKINEIVGNSSSFPVFTSNDDNATYKYSGSYPDISQVAGAGGGRGYDYFRPIPTTHFVGTLTKNNDPRLTLWISPKEGTEDRTLGVIPGINIGDIGRPASYSRRSVEFFNSATQIKGIFMTYAELNFLFAEAREKNILTTGSAKAYYELGVESSFAQWEVELPSDFVTKTVPYDSTNENLYEQKWLALYHSGVESWLDWKRTGKPSFLEAGVATVNNGKIPVRLKYPGLEASVNAENYKNAAESIGGDNINASVWWW